MNKQTQQLLLMLVIGIFIGTGAVISWSKRGPVSSETNSTDTTLVGATSSTDKLSAPAQVIQSAALPSAPQIPANTRAGLSVSDQAPGVTVSVSGLSFDAEHWIAIYDDREGTPSSILGAVRVHVGDVTANVELLRPTMKGSKYYAAILGDDGDSVFNRTTDLPPLSPDKVVIVSFVAK